MILLFIFIFQLSERPRKSAGLLLGVVNFKEKVLVSLRIKVKSWGAVMVSDAQIKGGDIHCTL